MNRRTLKERLLYHHVPLGIASVACCLLVFMLAKSNYLPFRLSMATAYTGMLLLGGTLVLGALKVLRGESSPVSTDWRRDTGIWAALFGLAHVVIGLQVQRLAEMFFGARAMPRRAVDQAQQIQRLRRRTVRLDVRLAGRGRVGKASGVGESLRCLEV